MLKQAGVCREFGGGRQGGEELRLCVIQVLELQKPNL